MFGTSLKAVSPSAVCRSSREAYKGFITYPVHGISTLQIYKQKIVPQNFYKNISILCCTSQNSTINRPIPITTLSLFFAKPDEQNPELFR